MGDRSIVAVVIVVPSPSPTSSLVPFKLLLPIMVVRMTDTFNAFSMPLNSLSSVFRKLLHFIFSSYFFFFLLYFSVTFLSLFYLSPFQQSSCTPFLMAIFFSLNFPSSSLNKLTSPHLPLPLLYPPFIKTFFTNAENYN